MDFDMEDHMLLTSPTQSNTSEEKETNTMTPNNASPEKTPPPEIEEERLMSLRQAYKKTKTNLVRAESHLEFIEQCLENKMTPHGLQIDIKCHAFLRELTPVDEQFQKSIKIAEESLTQALANHYRLLQNKLQKESQNLETKIQQALTLTKNKDVREAHQKTQLRTMNNIQNISEEIEQRKKRKLQNLKEPTPKRRKGEKHTTTSYQSPDDLPPRKATTPNKTKYPRRPMKQHKGKTRTTNQNREKEPSQEEESNQTAILKTLLERMNKIEQNLQTTTNTHPSQTNRMNFSKTYNRRSACYTSSHKYKTNKHNSKRTNKQHKNMRIRVSNILNEDKYITNLSSRSLTEGEISLLSKGLSFVPATPPNKQSINSSLERFDRSNRIRHFFRNQPEKEPHPFKVPSKWIPPRASEEIELYLKRIKSDMNKVKVNKHKKENLTPQEKKALRNLAQDPNLIIKQADKGSGIVLEDRENYIQDGLKHLSDKDIYEQVNSDPTIQLTKTINNYVQKMHSEGTIDTHTKDFLSFKENQPPRTPQIYFLKKIHKCPIAVRPIVSSCGGPTERISQFVDHHLQPFVSQIKSYLRDTKHLIQILENKRFPTKCTLVTIDVKSLYLNIPHKEGIQAVINRLYFKNKNSHNLKIPPNTLRDLLNIILTQNYFQFGEQTYHQLRGAAMGTKAAPAYANLFMAELEEELLEDLPIDPLLWKRFIDDVICILPITLKELPQIMHTLNKKHPTIKFTSEASNAQVDFMDLTIYKGDRYKNTSKLDIKPYFKKTNKFQYLHYSSAHPRNTFSSLIKGEMTRLLRACSDESTYEATKTKLYHIFKDRGYPHKLIRNTQALVPYANRQTTLQDKQRTSKQSGTFLIMEYNPQIKPSHIKNIIKPTPEEENTIPMPTLGFKKSSNLANILTRTKPKGVGKPPISETPVILTLEKDSENHSAQCGQPHCKCCPIMSRKTTITSTWNKRRYPTQPHTNCSSHNVIYLIECSKCSQQNQYVSSTTKPIRTRLSEHEAAFKIKPQLIFYKHFAPEDHDFTKHTKISILEKTTTEKLPKREIYWIHVLQTSYPRGLNSERRLTPKGWTTSQKR